MAPTLHPFLRQLGLRLPILQAPMAGVSSPPMAAAVTAAGGLGALGLGAMDAGKARAAIHAFRAACDGPLNVNLFVHRPARADAERETRWLERMAPELERFGARPPQALREIYTTFLDAPDMLDMLVEEKPAVASFHFGLPRADQVRALHNAGIVLLATATTLDEARAIRDAGLDAIVAQGYEAGGHRGMFDPDAVDSRLGTLVLTRMLAQSIDLPVIAAGGIMDGAGIAAVLAAGAQAAQLGTAFVATDESLADAGYRERLAGAAAHHTIMTRAISGRPARSLASDFTRWAADVPDADVPDYPVAYDAGKTLHAAAKAAGHTGFGAHWAGQGAPLARAMPTGQLMQALEHELDRALS